MGWQWACNATPQQHKSLVPGISRSRVLESETSTEGEPGDVEESNGCCKSNDKILSLPELLHKGLGDWLLIGVSLMGVGIFAYRSR